jgi:hypothetical protein
MSSKATQGPAGCISEVIQAREIHASVTLMERIANARRGYLTWLALETESNSVKESALDGIADVYCCANELDPRAIV